MIPPDASEIERAAWAVAEEAADWAAEQTGGRTPTWEMMDPMNRQAIYGHALTQIAINAALGRVPLPNTRMH